MRAKRVDDAVAKRRSATTALVACATRDARDLDGSGAISLAEIGACAQRGVDARAAARRLPGSRVTIGGNARLVPVIAAAATPAATPATGGTPGVAASLADLLAQRDGGWPLAWRPASGDAAPSLTSARDGFLSLILVGSPGGLAQPLWPPAGGVPVRVSAGVPTTIDDPALRARLRDPGQAAQVLAVVTARPRTRPEGTAAIGWLVEDDGFAATTVVAP
jgi:hypothetical protein